MALEKIKQKRDTEEREVQQDLGHRRALMEFDDFFSARAILLLERIVHERDITLSCYF